MKAVIQRVKKGSVEIGERNYYQSIGKGFVILLGISESDSENDVVFIADKCTNLRIFNDENDKMNLSLKDVNGEVLIISQFTLYGDARKGNRPSFIKSAKPDKAISLYESFIQRMKNKLGEENVKSGIFGEMMTVEIINDGPVTIIIESEK
ncbi:MAG: D-tyrosyl-tRNA(Tyr) deacylase [Melioribacteraceae bacterium]|nr:D-tyrosyl-tRNA(Tyr) deacylase [Melioribacteraceae bacterium]MCO6472426.1 D-tyrosyl-tRNA(Tyr) deacylase [Melioribacteraceae bacterium]MDD3558654.1 D-aminoacyl-tRNA deacylase [Melioribacteraceae bacterium]